MKCSVANSVQCSRLLYEGAASPGVDISDFQVAPKFVNICIYCKYWFTYRSGNNLRLKSVPVKGEYKVPVVTL